MKKVLIFSFTASIIFSAFFYAGAANVNTDPALLLKVKAVLDRIEKECPDEPVLLEQMKKAGASYIPELTADTKKADNTVNPKQMNLMVGIYLMDMTYAFVFDKKKECAKCAEAINKLLSKCGFNNDKSYKLYQKTMKELDSPDGKKNLQELINKLIDDGFNDLLKTNAGLEHSIDAFYAWTIEGLYISSEMAAQSNYNQKFMQFVNEKKPVINIIISLFDAIKTSPEIEKACRKDDRMALLSKIKSILSSGKIGSKEIDEIRAIVTKARKEIVK